eukprot:GFYU01010030.1.p1 GENE.GFYU01010030.1~~GFYU01010030.1.p1  ORF type:complete len:552 (-),score=98.19 GFYU01010030.1:82-1737(-)
MSDETSFFRVGKGGDLATRFKQSIGFDTRRTSNASSTGGGSFSLSPSTRQASLSTFDSVTATISTAESDQLTFNLSFPSPPSSVGQGMPVAVTSEFALHPEAFTLDSNDNVADASHYCIYRYTKRRSSSSVDVLNPAVSPPSDTESLQILISNLSSVQEDNVRTFMTGRIKRNQLSLACDVAILPRRSDHTTTNPKASTLCYFCLVPGRLGLEPTGDVLTVDYYLVCLVCELVATDGYALFRGDLGDFLGHLSLKLPADYAKVMSKSLHNGSSPRVSESNYPPSPPLNSRSEYNVEALKTALESWFNRNIFYLETSVLEIGPELPAFLYSAIHSLPIVVVGEGTKARDVIRFATTVGDLKFGGPIPRDAQRNSLKTLPMSTSMTRNDSLLGELNGMDSPRPSNVVHMTSKEFTKGGHTHAMSDALVVDLTKIGDLKLSKSTTNDFCTQWSASFFQSVGDTPGLRKVLEDTKSQVCADVQRLQQLAIHSQLDNYCLYKLCEFVRGNRNKDMLIAIFKKIPSSARNQAGLLEVMETISDYIQTPSTAALLSQA